MYRSSLSQLLSTGVRVSVAALVLLLAHSPVHSAPLGTAFTHKGEYKPGGTAVTGVYDFQIVLFNVATLGMPIVSPVTHENVPVTQGNFTVEINYGAPPFATATQYWLETRVRPGISTGAFMVVGRQKLNAVPYALNVRTLPPGIVTGTSIAPNAVGPVAILDNSITATDIGTNAVGLTEINPMQVQTRVIGGCPAGQSLRAIAQNGTVICDAGGSTAWRLLGNAGTNPLSHFLGTTDNQPLNFRVNNQRVLQLEPNAISPNLIGGHAANFVTTGVRGATIGGGGVPTGDTDPIFSGEGPNRVTDAYGTVGGGYNNQAGNNEGTTFDQTFTTVGGGWGNIASGAYGTVAGGWGNTVNGAFSTVAGGQGNIASGAYGTVAGGWGNIASGDYSFVVGRLAKNADPTHDGVFMFADSQFIEFLSAGPNTFNVRAQGGMHLNTQTNLFFGAQTRQMLTLWNVPGVDNYGIGVQAGTLYFRTGDHFSWFRDGVHHDGTFQPGAGGTETMRLDASGNLSIRGAFGSLSDRTMKTDFTAVNSQEVLEQVIALPIQNWRYKHDQGTRHIGPVAQDFHAAFAVGTDDKHIATVDADGVAFAAIQGLYRKGEQENAKLRAENAKMKARLAALEAEATKHARTHARVEALEARFERMFQARAGE